MKIEIACDAVEATEFVEWLQGRGHDAIVGETTGNFIDGVHTSSSINANDILADLWAEYCS